MLDQIFWYAIRAWLFLQVPDYYEVIKEPMDFGTMRKNINKGVYVTLNLFEVIPAPAVLPLLALQWCQKVDWLDIFMVQ